MSEGKVVTGYLRWRFSGRLCLALLAPLAPAAAQDVSGLAFDVTITIGDSATSITQTGRGWIAGKSSRVDLAGPGNPAMAIPGMPGRNISYLVGDSIGAPAVATVDHDTKMVMFPAKFMAQLQSMMASLPETPRISFSVNNVVLDSLGPGETISGFATKRFRLAADISMSIEIMGESMDQSMHVVSEADYSEELADYTDPLQTTRSIETFASGVPGMDSTAAAELSKVVLARPRGLPLRQTDRSTGASEGETRVQSSVTVLSNIRRAEFSPSIFVVPSDYKELAVPVLPGIN